MVMHPNNLAAGKGFGLHHGFKVCKTANYLGVFIEDDASKRDYLKYRTSKWDKYMLTMTKTAGKYPQEIYVVVVCVVQSELTFFQCVTKDTGHAFSVVEKIPQEKNLPCIFFVKSRSLLPIVGTLSKMPVKK